MSQDDISWKTTDDAPSNLSLAIAVCSWPELIPAIETGNRSTMICITCRYKVSIRTQVLQGRFSSKLFNPYLTKPTPRRVCRTSIKETLQKANTSRRSKYREGRFKNAPKWWRRILKKLLDWARRTTRLLSCWRLSRPRKQIVATKTWTAGIYCKITI